MKKFNEFVEHTRLVESTKYLQHIDREAIEREFAELGIKFFDALPTNIREWIKFFDELDWWGTVIDAHIHGTELENTTCPFDYKKSPREFVVDFNLLKSNEKTRIAIEKAFWKAGSNVNSIISVVQSAQTYLVELTRTKANTNFINSVKVEDGIIKIEVDIQEYYKNFEPDWYDRKSAQRFNPRKIFQSAIKLAKLKNIVRNKISIKFVNEFPENVIFDGDLNPVLNMYVPSENVEEIIWESGHDVYYTYYYIDSKEYNHKGNYTIETEDGIITCFSQDYGSKPTNNPRVVILNTTKNNVVSFRILHGKSKAKKVKGW